VPSLRGLVGEAARGLNLLGLVAIFSWLLTLAGRGHGREGDRVGGESGGLIWTGGGEDGGEIYMALPVGELEGSCSSEGTAHSWAQGSLGCEARLVGRDLALSSCSEMVFCGTLNTGGEEEGGVAEGGVLDEGLVVLGLPFTRDTGTLLGTEEDINLS